MLHKYFRVKYWGSYLGWTVSGARMIIIHIIRYHHNFPIFHFFLFRKQMCYRFILCSTQKVMWNIKHGFLYRNISKCLGWWRSYGKSFFYFMEFPIAYFRSYSRYFPRFFFPGIPPCSKFLQTFLSDISFMIFPQIH